MDIPEFVEFPKIARLSREIIVTEKIDGTNGVVFVSDDGGTVLGAKPGRSGGGKSPFTRDAQGAGPGPPALTAALISY